MAQFAEEELRIPQGKWAGRRFRLSRQPYARLAFREIDSGRWSRFIFVGPTQSGKTLHFWVIPLLYHLFEVGEPAILGVPDLNMRTDKWRDDILPAIEATRFRDLLPVSGSGSKSGVPVSVHFRNGTNARFMSAGGDDKARAGKPARVLIVTELEGFDRHAATSREANKFRQLEGRLRGRTLEERRLYAECTVGTEEGLTWQEYQQGSASQIYLQCPACNTWVLPGRENCVGWQEAEDEKQAHRKSAYSCPECAELWAEADRRAMNENARLVHRGQTIDGRGVHGDPPGTYTLGFRWDAINNLFVEPGDVGVDEWRAERAQNRDDAEKEQRQFVWALPHIPEKLDVTELDLHSLAARQKEGVPRGHVPEGTKFITMAIDLGKWRAHWAACAWHEDGGGVIIDYGVYRVPSDSMPADEAISVALRDVKEIADEGWIEPQGSTRPADQLWIDSGGGWDGPVYGFIRSLPKSESRRVWPVKGYGAAQERRRYTDPRARSKGALHVGDGFWFSHQKAHGVILINLNSDRWKSFVHEHFACPAASGTALLLYHATRRYQHNGFVSQILAERQREEFTAGKGLLRVFEQIERDNHYLDAVAYLSAGASFLGLWQAPQPRRGAKKKTIPIPKPKKKGRRRR